MGGVRSRREEEEAEEEEGGGWRGRRTQVDSSAPTTS